MANWAPKVIAEAACALKGADWLLTKLPTSVNAISFEGAVVVEPTPPVSLTTALVPPSAKPTILLKKVDVLTINDEEARQLSNTYSLVKAAALIQEMGPKIVIIKKGEHGALLFHGSQMFFAPALPLEDVFDPTGAGDTFAGGFVAHLAKTKDFSFNNMKSAIIVGSALASFCVEKFGTQRLTEISKADIKERIQSFVQLVNFDIELV